MQARVSSLFPSVPVVCEGGIEWLLLTVEGVRVRGMGTKNGCFFTREGKERVAVLYSSLAGWVHECAEPSEWLLITPVATSRVDLSAYRRMANRATRAAAARVTNEEDTEATELTLSQLAPVMPAAHGQSA